MISTGPFPCAAVQAAGADWTPVRAWERQHPGCLVTLPPSTITSPALLLLPCSSWNFFQLDKCTPLQLQPSSRKTTTRKKKTTTQLPRAPNTLPSRGQTLTKLPSGPHDPLHPYLHRQLPSNPPATMVSLCPDNTNGLGFQLILPLFKRKKKGRHQHRIGGSGHSLQWH